jgi:diacylglycerol kinase (ATP)
MVQATYIVDFLAGNDLARVLRWGPGYTGGEDPMNLLRDVIDAEEIRLDRWTVVFHPEDKGGDEKTQQVANSTGKSILYRNKQITR